MPARQVDPDSLGFLVTDLSRLLRAEIDRRTSEAGVGLTPGEARTLMHAARAGPVRQNALAERMGVEAMTLSAYLDRLEAAGLIERQPDPQDRRAKIVCLAEAAGPVIDRIVPVAAAIRAEASRGIPAREWEHLLDLLKRTRRNLMAERAKVVRAGKGGAS
ncbi:MAG: MarR family transcriptional regulator [Rhizobiaceae bacterium]|jgi:MarR family transcriptional regulator for hemolysin|nr:MarR family transcriptional regulator [Rhizobiaceae bacterium]